MFNKKLIKIVASNIVKRLQNNGIVYAIGNGGSASEASHLIGELIGKFNKIRKPIKAISLTDASVVTCIANDFGYDEIYARQLSALLEQKDVLVSFTTSGNSKNILEALKIAKYKMSYSICLCGNNYSHLECDVVIPVFKNSTDEIQEQHIKYVHTLVKMIEKQLYE